MAMGPFLAEILQIPYLTLKIQDENRPKSNQVIYRSGPTIVLNMKDIPKVVKKLSLEQESAAGSGGIRTSTKKHKVTPDIPGWLNNELCHDSIVIKFPD